MNPKIMRRDDSKMVVQFEVPISGSMLSDEECLLDALNEAGCLVTGDLLKRFDTDGRRIEVGGVVYTARSCDTKTYQTPFGAVSVPRYVYQTSRGGPIYCPLENKARIVGTATPRFAKMVSSKYSALGAAEVVRDLKENHNRPVARSFVKNLADLVATVAEAKQEAWSYHVPALDEPVRTITLGLDGTTIRMTDGSFRIAMVATIGLYDANGIRLHTMYCGAAPEYGKERFMGLFEREIKRTKLLYPDSLYIGIADGASDNWPILEQYTTKQLIDFYHATGYLGNAVKAVFAAAKGQDRARKWLDDACHDLKHKSGATARILDDLREWLTWDLSDEKREAVSKAATYFTNNESRMKYYSFTRKKLPIGSGVTEAACKTIIKQRLCKSGMKWKVPGASKVISLRCLNQSKGRWKQFWSKIERYGFLLP